MGQHGSPCLWADWITVCQLIGYSPYFMAHSVEAVLPLDITETTYLLPLLMFLLQPRISLQDLHDMLAIVLKARKQSAAQLSSASLLLFRIMTFQLDHCHCVQLSYPQGA